MSEQSVTDVRSINPFTRPANDAPWWVLPILTFIVGVAITAAVLMPIHTTPEYLRGKADGFREGRVSADEGWEATVRDARESGRLQGLKECATH